MSLGAARSIASGRRGGQGSRIFEVFVRVGFLARALTYGVVGALAFALAAGAGTDRTTPNQQGALELVSRAPLGRAALVVVAVGLIAYAVWKLILGVSGSGPEGGGGTDVKDRVANLAGGVAYLMFFLVACRVLFGSAGNASSGPRHATAGVLGWPGGRWLVGAAGIALIAVSIYQIIQAISGDFAGDSKTQQMGQKERTTFMVLGRAGLAARALVFVLIGYFVLQTAITFKPGNTVGVDGALERLDRQPFGPWLVGLVAVGLLVFAAYSVIEARYRRL